MHAIQIPVPLAGAASFGAWATAGKRALQELVHRYRAYRQRCVIANLPDLLRYDIGEIDIRPETPRHQPHEAPNVTLESLQLRYR